MKGHLQLGGRFDIFYFFLLGEAEGGVRGAGSGGGIDFLLKIPGGGVSRRGGAEGPGGWLQRIWELGGAKYFFRGRNIHQVKHLALYNYKQRTLPY